MIKISVFNKINDSLIVDTFKNVCVQEEEYIEWMAAMKLACRGRTMADMPGYQAELHALRSLLRLHHSCPSPSPASPPLSASGTADTSVAVRIADLVAARHLNRLRHKQVRLTTTGAHLQWRH